MASSNAFLQKLKRYSIVRLVGIIQHWRCFFYFHFLSENSPDIRLSKIKQPVQFKGQGKISLESVVLGVSDSPCFLSGYSYIEARNTDSSISIGSGCEINNSICIIAGRGRIEIGRRCLIGHGVVILNSDFHGLSIDDRRSSNYESKDILIGDDVFIGNNVKILKGVQIGSGSVVGGSSVVVKDIPGGAVYAGNPAKLIRYL